MMYDFCNKIRRYLYAKTWMDGHLSRFGFKRSSSTAYFQFGAPFPYSSTLTQSDYNSQRLSSLIGMSGLGAGMVDLSSCMNE